MGLLDKIEDKLSSNKSDSSKLEKSNYDSNTGTSGTTSKLQHPISSSTGGTYGSSTGNTSGQDYGRYQDDNSRYTDSSRDRVPGSYPTQTESHHPSHTTSTSTTTRVEPRQAYDPYSSKGQERAAQAGTTGYGSSHDRQGEHYGVTGRDDPSVARSRDGGILNQSSGQRHGDQRYDDQRYGDERGGGIVSSGQRHGDQRYDDQRYGDERYGTQQTSSTSPSTGQHHYGRDAALAGGAGAAGLGAYEVGKDHPSHQPLTSSQGQQQYQDPSYPVQTQQTSPLQHSTRDASMAGGGMQPGAMGSQQSPVSGESAGLTQARKMGGAYEAGYKDAMKHMQEEMQKGGSAF